MDEILHKNKLSGRHLNSYLKEFLIPKALNFRWFM